MNGRWPGALLPLALAAILCACGDDPGPDSALTGALLWQDAYDGGSSGSRGRDVGYAVAACGDRAFAAGSSSAGGQEDDDFLIRAYETSTGDLLWQDRAGAATHDRARSVVCQRNRVFAIGNFGSTAVIRAYDAHDGTVLWSNTFEHGAETEFKSVEATRRAVLVFAVSQDSSRQPETLGEILAYDIATGGRLWKNPQAFGASWTDGSLAAAEAVACLAQSRAVRCVDIESGLAQWVRRTDRTKQDHYAAPSFAENAGTVFVAGSDGPRDYDFGLRGYSLASR